MNAGALSICVIAHVVGELGVDAVREALPHCRGKSFRQVEEWIAANKPPERPRDRVVVRAPLPSTEPEAERPGSMFEPPLEAEPPRAPAYSYTFTASADLHRAIERLKDLLWTKYPFGTLDEFLKVAVVAFLERNDPVLLNEASPRRKSPGTTGRRVPAAVRNAVWARDGGRCVYVMEDGTRCAARRGLELDHIVPYSQGGRSDEPDNVRLLCREHNQLERRRILGEGTARGPHEPAGREAPS